MPNPVRVQLHPNPDDQSWNVTLPPGTRVVDYALTLDEGRAMLSLILPVDSVHVGEVPGTTAQVRTNDEQQAARTVWGKPGADPREQIPGWKPEGNQPVTLNVSYDAEVSPILDTFRKLIRRGGAEGVLA